MTIHHCCQRLRDAIEFRCDRHPEVGVCGDALIGYSEKFNEYGLWVHDGPSGSASSRIEIHHCPFCGGRMSPSRRDEWFDRLEALGLEPDNAPAEMQSSRWWLGEGETARRTAWMPEKKTWDWVCLTVLPRVGMWTGQVRFGLAVAWIEGFVWGNGESITNLMQERCEKRLGRRTPLGWHQYVKADALGVSVNEMPSDSEMSDEQHRSAIAALRVELMDALEIGDQIAQMADDFEGAATRWVASRAMADIVASGYAQADIDEFFEPANPVEIGLQWLLAALGEVRQSHPDVIAMLVVPLPATMDLTVNAPDLASVASTSWKYGPGREVVGLYLLQPWVLAAEEPGEEYRCHVDADDLLGGGWSACFRSWRSHADAVKGWEFNRAFYLRARSSKAEDWLRTEAVAAFDSLRADPARAVPAEAVRLKFEVKWGKRSRQELADESELW